jgi:hypothetical protein
MALGTAAVFNSGGTDFIKMSRLTDTAAVAAWSDNGDGGKAKARVCTVSGTDITLGPVTTVNNADSDYVSVGALTSASAVFMFKDIGNAQGLGANRPCVRAAAISGTDITYGAAVAFAAAGSWCEVCPMDSTHAIVTANDATPNQQARLCTVSGLNATLGAANNISPTVAGSKCSVAKLDSTHAVAALRVSGTSHGRSYQLAVAGATITKGNAAVFNAGDVNLPWVVRLSSTEAVVMWPDSADATGLSVVKATLSGADLTKGAEKNVYGTVPDESAMDQLGPGQFVVAYKDDGGAGHGAYKVGTVSGADITLGAQDYFTTDVISHNGAAGDDPFRELAVVRLTDTKVVFAWANNGNGDEGKMVALDMAPATTTAPPTTTTTAPPPAGISMTFSPSKSANSGRAADGWMNGQTVARLSAGKFVVVYTDTATGRCRAQVFTAPSARPTVDSPIANGATSVSGTGVDGSAIEVYVNGASAGAADGAVSGGVWAKTGMSLSTGDTVKAKQTEPGGKPKSGFSNTVGVSATPSALYWVRWGDPQTWLGGFSLPAIGPMSVCALDSTHIVVLWRDDNGNAKVRAGFLNYGAHITWGLAKTVAAAKAAESVSVVALTPTKFLACYTDAGGSGGTLWVAAGTVSDDVYVTVGPIIDYTYHTDATHIQCAALAPGLAVCTYVRPGYPTTLYAVSVAVSGAATFGTLPASISSITSGSFGFVAGLTSAKFVHMYRDAAGGRVRVGTVATGAISYADAATFTAAAIGDYGFVCALDTTHIAVVYGDAGGAKAAVGVVSGTAVSFGAPNAFFAGAVTKLKCEALDSARFVVAVCDAVDVIRTWVGTVSGVDATFSFVTHPSGGGATVVNAWLSGQTLAKLYSGRVAIVYSNSGNDVSNTYPTYIEPLSDNRGKVRIGDVSS